jgi:transcriptional regulator with XRE-family HTH domain
VRKIYQRKNDAFLIALGEGVRTRRIELLLTQEELAYSAGLHRTYITDIESGKRNVAVLTLRRIAKALDVPLFKLIKAAEAVSD